MRVASDVKSSESPDSGSGATPNVFGKSAGSTKKKTRCFAILETVIKIVASGTAVRAPARRSPTGPRGCSRTASSVPSRKCSAPSHKRTGLRSVDQNLQLPVKKTQWKPDEVWALLCGRLSSISTYLGCYIVDTLCKPLFIKGVLR